MRKIPVLMLLPPVIFAAFVVMVYVGMTRENPDELPSTMIGRMAPRIDPAPLADFPTFTEADLAGGGPKLVNFWASWCAPCRVEHPNLMKLKDEIPIYGVNQKDRPEAATGFIGELGNPFTALAVDPVGRQSTEWGVYGLPETFVLDGQGRIVARIVGALTERVIARSLRPALEAAKAADAR
ncbi:DsbE family thiol:disulfide interchange protein [Brevirhabdus sp.]|uniref:DsbE family thiol:disulfide interchange protein n=1 Tax=Brevirhabdus sp. TaxID=2004514 RepID=UPI004057F146